MIPILYPADVTAETFQNTNGLGRLPDCISATVEEELNGEYVLTLEYPMTGARYSEITYNCVIGVVPHFGGTKQAFRIVKLSRPIGGVVTVTAYHISYDLSMIPCMPIDSTYGVSTVFANLKNYAGAECAFTFSTDLTSSARFSKLAPSSMKSTLGGVSGSILDIYGGYYAWDNWTVKLLKSRGEKKNITIRYGKNLTDITQEEAIESMYTGCCPYWSKTQENGKTQTVVLPEKIIESEYASQYPNPRIEMLDLTSYYDVMPSVATLRNIAKKYVAAAKNYGVPQVSIKVSFVDLRNTTEYKDMASLEGISLGDTVGVKFERLGISTDAKVQKTTWNVLNESYDSIELGEVKSGLADSINSALAGLQGLQTTVGGTTTQKTYTNIYTVARDGHTNRDGFHIKKWIRGVKYDETKFSEYSNMWSTLKMATGGGYIGMYALDAPATVSDFYSSQISARIDRIGDYEDSAGKALPVIITNLAVEIRDASMYSDDDPQTYIIFVRARFWYIQEDTGQMIEITDNPLSLDIGFEYIIGDAQSLHSILPTKQQTYPLALYGTKDGETWERVYCDDIVTEYIQE